MKPTKEQLECLKRIELEMLKEFISVCKRLKLRYYLLGGTLLGAVRHKGFIPWDDDIDVGMLRKDYEIFIHKAQYLLPDRYFVQTTFSDPDFPMNFCKIRDSNTTFIESSVKDCNINHGVFIDVFPLDYYPDKPLDAMIFNIKNKLFLLCISRVFYLPGESKRIKGKVRGTVSKILTLYMPNRTAVKKREKLLRSTHGCQKLANYCGAWGQKEIVPVEWYGEGAELEFETLNVIGPKEYDKWLTKVYGDYWKLPPPEKRVGHHYTEVIDLEKAYTEYTGK